jgi:hypothetical protein
VPELAAVTGAAAVDVAVDHDATAHARRDGEVDHVPRARAGAEAMLSGGRGRGVVVERGRATVDVLGHGDGGHVTPPGQVRRREDDAGPRVERSAAGDADGRDLLAGVDNRLTPELPEPCESRLWADRRWSDQERLHGPVLAHDARRELRSSNIQSENEASHLAKNAQHSWRPNPSFLGWRCLR